jgi:hypothetical protein
VECAAGSRCPLTHWRGMRMTPSVVVLNPQLAPLDATREPRRAPSPSPLSISSLRLLLRLDSTRLDCPSPSTSPFAHSKSRRPNAIERTRVARIAPHQESRRPACAPAASAATASLCVPFKSSLLYNIASVFVFLAFSLDSLSVCECAPVCVCLCVSLCPLQI